GFFFFIAEDGIRVRNVTGVQTCALPISRSSIENIIFISSTSVYPPQSGIVAEVDAVADKAASETGNALLKAENMLLEQSSFETLVLRFGGLYGYDRHPIHYLAGGTNLENGNAPVNLIHRDDGI